MDFEEKFLSAKRKYNIAFSQVDEMFRKFSLFANGEVDVDMALKTFDILLQYSLLQIAAADGTFDISEIDFISNLTKKGDLIDYVNEIEGTNYSWSSIYFSRDLVEFLDSSLGELEELAETFGENLGRLDNIFSEKDYFEAFRSNVVGILTDIILIDGKMDLKEIVMSSGCLVIKVLQQYLAIKN